MIYFGHFSFSSFHLELKRQIRLYATRGSLENHTRFKTIMVKIYTRFQNKKGSKTIPFWATHTYISYKGVYTGHVGRGTVKLSTLFHRQELLPHIISLYPGPGVQIGTGDHIGRNETIERQSNRSYIKVRRFDQD